MLQHSMMVQLLHVKAVHINVQHVLELLTIAYLVQQVVLDQHVLALIQRHSIMGVMLNVKAAHINVPPALEFLTIAYLVQ